MEEPREEQLRIAEEMRWSPLMLESLWALVVMKKRHSGEKFAGRLEREWKLILAMAC